LAATTTVRATIYVTGATTGSNTFTAQYRSGTATKTCTFANRSIAVIPVS